MTPLAPHQLHTFVRRYRWCGRVKAVHLRQRRGEPVIDLLLRLRRAVSDLSSRPEPVMLHLRLEGVEEGRMQRRPGRDACRFERGMLAHLNGLYFISLDDWLLPAGEQPGMHDFRGSDLYFASARLLWAERPRRSS